MNRGAQNRRVGGGQVGAQREVQCVDAGAQCGFCGGDRRGVLGWCRGGSRGEGHRGFVIRAVAAGRLVGLLRRTRSKSRGATVLGSKPTTHFGAATAVFRQRWATRLLAGSHACPVASGRNWNADGPAALGESDIGHSKVFRDVANGFAPDEVVELLAGERERVLVRHGRLRGLGDGSKRGTRTALGIAAIQAQRMAETAGPELGNVYLCRSFRISTPPASASVIALAMMIGQLVSAIP